LPIAGVTRLLSDAKSELLLPGLKVQALPRSRLSADKQKITLTFAPGRYRRGGSGLEELKYIEKWLQPKRDTSILRGKSKIVPGGKSFQSEVAGTGEGT
jgi:hypothetical protein